MTTPSIRNHAYRWPIVLLVMHIVAIVFGLIGILLIVPNIQEIIARDARALDVYNWSMQNAGATHIVFGALAMFAFGVVALGWSQNRRLFRGFGIGFPRLGTDWHRNRFPVWQLRIHRFSRHQDSRPGPLHDSAIVVLCRAILLSPGHRPRPSAIQSSISASSVFCSVHGS